MVTLIAFILSIVIFAVIFNRMYGNMWLFLTVCYTIIGIIVIYMGP